MHAVPVAKMMGSRVVTAEVQWPLFSICPWHKLTLRLLVKDDRWKIPGSTGSTRWHSCLLPSQWAHFQGFSLICISFLVPERSPCRWLTVHASLLLLTCKKIVPKPYTIVILWLLGFKMSIVEEVPDHLIFSEITGSLMHVICQVGQLPKHRDWKSMYFLWLKMLCLKSRGIVKITRITVRRWLSKEIKVWGFFSAQEKGSFWMFLKRHSSPRAGLFREAVWFLLAKYPWRTLSYRWVVFCSVAQHMGSDRQRWLWRE